MPIVVKQHPHGLIIAGKLFGIEMVPTKEQTRMVHAACKAAMEHYDATIQADRARIKELSNTVVRLLGVLPNTGRMPEPCWEWCWNELSDDAQELVEGTAKAAYAILETMK